jgi:hypothetical protein
MRPFVPQEPAQGILKTNDFGDSIWYHIRCSCGSDDCSHEVNVEADEIDVSVHIYANNHTKWWEKSRWKQIWQILTKGYAEMQTTIVLDEQTAVNYAAALTNAVEDVKVLRKKMMDERKAKSNERN